MRIGRTLPPAAAPIYFKDIISGFKGLCRGQRELERFESELTEYFGVKHCFLVSSGKAALTLILQALKDIRPERDEVLIPAFTCYSVPSAIVRAGLKVKLCDIDPDTLDFDFKQLSQILSQYSAKAPNKLNKPDELSAISYELQSNSKLLAIIPVHLFGLPADIEWLREMVEDPDVMIIEDAAQTMGAEWNGRKLGTLGDAGFFSLGRGKALSAVEGGIILTNRDDISEKISARMKEIRNYSVHNLLSLIFKAVVLTFFLHPNLFWFPKSLPFLKLGDTIYDPHFKIRKLSTFQVGLAKDWKRKLKRFKETRTNNSRKWTSILTGCSTKLHCYGINEIPPTQEIQQSRITQNTELPDLIRFPVRIDNEGLRTRLLVTSDHMGLGIMYTYPDSIDRIQELKTDFNGLAFPAARDIARYLITIPIHPFVSEKDQTRIAALIAH